MDFGNSRLAIVKGEKDSCPIEKKNACAELRAQR